jgi:hypothetical protein
MKATCSPGSGLKESSTAFGEKPAATVNNPPRRGWLAAAVSINSFGSLTAQAPPVAVSVGW